MPGGCFAYLSCSEYQWSFVMSWLIPLFESVYYLSLKHICNFFPLFRLQSYNFFPINPSVFCNFLPIEVLIVIKLPVSNHISFGLRLVSGMTGCMGDEVGQTSSISMAFMLEVILRSNRSVFNDHITVKFVLKLFQTYIIPIIFFIFAMVLPLLPSPKPMTNLQGCR